MAVGKMMKNCGGDDLFLSTFGGSVLKKRFQPHQNFSGDDFLDYNQLYQIIPRC